MSLSRRSFVGALGAGAATIIPSSPDRSLLTRHAEPISAVWDMSWTDRMPGKFKAVFDSPEVNDGAALYRALFWRDGHKEVYGTTSEEMSLVLVLRHQGIVLAMNDDYWRRFKIGKRVKSKNEKGKWAEANPIGARSPSAPPSFADYNLESFIAGGGIVLACNLAFRSIVSDYQKEDKLTAEQAREEALKRLISGVILQPSGIFAALRAQEAGCNYVMGS